MTRPRLTLLHGFTQTGRSFEPLLAELSRHFDVLTPDLPGHGTMGRPGGQAEAPTDEPPGQGARGELSRRFEVLTRDLLVRDRPRVSTATGGAGAGGVTDGEAFGGFWLGYSMGARVALTVALERPELVDRLVLVSATAGIEDAANRAERRRADEALAASLEAEGVDAFLGRWLAQPMFAGLPPGAAGLGARRENTAGGLAGALRLLGQGSFEPVWDRLLDLRMPVLVVAGEHDDTYCEQALRLGAWIGERATLAMVPGAGHACHLEAPEPFVDLVVGFLTEGEQAV
ncbi:MAG TPA: alpha/beta fold hydrolase [Acidimicrobiales bacterium]|nr:alpha/beta fold hydrolase [Acidimicrobiales bacterium]